MEIVFVSILYWIAVAIMFLVGLGQLIFAKRTEQNKTPGLKLLIITVIMVVIGGGACLMLLSGLSIH
ncbi:hypothetical protein [Pedobacter sp.]|uniref:hypothetical protein n=1 Tax=Pedobacter sp. TaxID=1411316 RepID=UPI0031E466DF